MTGASAPRNAPPAHARPAGRLGRLAALRYEGLVAFLGLSVLLLLLPPLMPTAISPWTVAGLLTLLAVNALVLLARGRGETAITALLALPLVASLWGHVLVDAPVLSRTWFASGAAFFAWSAGLLLREVLRPGRVDRERLGGALAAYLMLGFAGGFVHGFVELAAPGSYRGLSGAGADAAAGDLMYFSFTTITTTGYGDITPASSLARALAMLQALLGLAYLGVVVARIVGRVDAAAPDGAAGTGGGAE